MDYFQWSSSTVLKEYLITINQIQLNIPNLSNNYKDQMKWQVGYWDLKASVAGVYKSTLVFACIFVLFMIILRFDRLLWHRKHPNKC